MTNRHRLIGDRTFYRSIMRVAVPIMIQNGITNLVGMLDNVMVGHLGTDPMSGVAIVNQLMFIFNLCVFGGTAGIGIFTAQFHGNRDEEGVRYTFRMQIILAVLLSAAGAAAFLLFGRQLIGFYLHQDGSGASVTETLRFAMNYLAVMYAGLLPFAVTQVYSTTLRNTGETVVPMRAGILAVFVNLAGNWVLIYGKLGMPALGVQGAAAATVLSRFVEMAVVMLWTHRHIERNAFIIGVYRKLFRIPKDLVRTVSAKAAPLLANEALWSGGQAALMQCYSTRGLATVAALNIAQTVANVFNISFLAMGNAIGIQLGHQLGEGKIEEARQDAGKHMLFSVLICVATGGLLLSVSGLFPLLYNTTDQVRHMATLLIRVGAVCMPLYAFANASYFILRCGGKTLVTFLFDSCFAWGLTIPCAFILTRFTSVPTVPLYFIVQMFEAVKCVLGFFMVRSGIWAQNLTKYEKV